MAELWGSVVISVLFWGFAISIFTLFVKQLAITTVEEAKEFYPLFGLGANIALIFSGRTVKYFSNLRNTLGPGVDGWEISLKGMMSIVIFLGCVICGIYWGVNKFIVNDPSVPRTEYKKKRIGEDGMKLDLCCFMERPEAVRESTYVKGKAAIDVVCNPLGKSGGALIQQFMILSFGSLANSTPYLGGILLVIVLAWLGAASSLDSQFSKLAKQDLEKKKKKEKAMEPVIDVSAKEISSLDGKEGRVSFPETTQVDEFSSNGSPLKQKPATEETLTKTPRP
ncbi:hypothetical protein KSP40_PGU022529 [Platanthera guangdongensis]|uniref:ADP,ATP carrier protein n=1 Tax=Platanthera guangdongensis TaxID=2320717 RepID=A0ABR2LG80_9ASPA